jgi:hypothetical protein
MDLYQKPTWKKSDPIIGELPDWMQRAVWGFLATFLLGMVLLLALVLCGGCRQWSVKPSGQVFANDPAAGISEPLTRAEVRRELAVSQIELATPKISGEPKTHIEVAGAAMKQQAKDLKEAREGVKATQANEAEVREQYEKTEAQLTHLKGQWYVKVGIWIERSVWVIAISWIVLNAIAFAGGIGSPGGWFAWIAKQIRLFLPAMNVSSWLLAWRQNAGDKQMKGAR